MSINRIERARILLAGVRQDAPFSKSGKQKVQKQVKGKDGKTFTRTYWVRPNEGNRNEEKRVSRTSNLIVSAVKEKSSAPRPDRSEKLKARLSEADYNSAIGFMRELGISMPHDYDGMPNEEAYLHRLLNYGYMVKSKRVPFVPPAKPRVLSGDKADAYDERLLFGLGSIHSGRSGKPESPPYERLSNPSKYMASRGYIPQKTKKIYKVANINSEGQLVPSMVDDVPIKMNQWLDAEYIPTNDLCPRPGMHGGVLPIQRKQRKEGKIPLSSERVWIECEVPDDVDWESILEQEGGNLERNLKKRQSQGLLDEVPRGGHYTMGEHGALRGTRWVVAGSAKFNRILEPSEVESLIKGHLDTIKKEGAPKASQFKDEKSYKKALDTYHKEIALLEKDMKLEQPTKEAVAVAKAYAQGLPIPRWNWINTNLAAELKSRGIDL